jgi:lipoprotein-releasing system permease protein
VLFCLNIGAIQAAVESVTGPVFPADVYGLSGLPAELVWTDVVKILFMALGLSFIATLYPAWKAANLDPVEALRYE